MLVYVSLVILFTWQIKYVTSHNPNTGSLDSTRSSDSFVNAESPLGSHYNLCGGINVKNKASGADRECRKECLALQSEINTINDFKPDNKINQLFHGRCGMVTDGQCRKGKHISRCLCLTPKKPDGHQSTHIWICYYAALLMRVFTKVGATASGKTEPRNIKKQPSSQSLGGNVGVENIGCFLFPPKTPESGSTSRGSYSAVSVRRRRNFPSATSGQSLLSLLPLHPMRSRYSRSSRQPSQASRPRAETDPSSFQALPSRQEASGSSSPKSDDILWAGVWIAGKKVRAMLDTGSPFTSINPEHVKERTRYTGKQYYRADNQPIKIKWESIINLEFKKGNGISFKALVTDMADHILLGNDFFVSHAAKINIPERRMDITIDQTTLPIKLEFAPFPDRSCVLTNGSSLTALRVSLNMNGRDRIATVDTGSSTSYVSKKLVREQPIQPTERDCYFGDSRTAVRFRGKTDITIQIDASILKFEVSVPSFKPPLDLVLGNDFNKIHVVLIDFEPGSESVTFNLPDPSGYSQQVTRPVLLRE